MAKQRPRPIGANVPPVSGVDPLLDLDRQAQAWRGISGEIEAQEKALERIGQLLDPSLIKRQVDLQDQLNESRREYGKALDAEQKLLPALVQEIASADDRRIEALKSINQEIESQEQMLARINGAMNPEIMERQVALQVELTEARQKHAKAIEDERKAQPAAVQIADTPEERRLEALKSINQSLESQEKALSRINEELKPDQLEKRVRLEREMEEAKGKRDSGLAQERLRQGDPKAQQDLMGRLMGGAQGMASGGIGGAVKGLGGGAGIGQLMGSVGMGAMAGPVGMAIEAAQMVSKAVKDMAVAPFKAVSEGLKELTGSLGPIGVGFKAIEGFSAKFGLVGEIVSGVTAQFHAMTETLVGMAQVANPAAFKLWNWALLDLQAVIGQRFVPILGLMRDAVRFLGDVLTTVLPTPKEVAEALQPLQKTFEDLKKEITRLLIDLRPVLLATFKIVVSAVDMLIHSLISLTKILRVVTEAAGFKSVGKLGSGLGAASSQASFSGIAQLGEKATLATLMSGGGATPAQITADNTTKMSHSLRVLTFSIGSMAAKMTNIHQLFADVMGMLNAFANAWGVK